MVSVVCREGAEEGICEETSCLLLGQCDGVSDSLPQQRDWLKAQGTGHIHQQHLSSVEVGRVNVACNGRKL